MTNWGASGENEELLLIRVRNPEPRLRIFLGLDGQP